jgi:hypothetical protein
MASSSEEDYKLPTIIRKGVEKIIIAVRKNCTEELLNEIEEETSRIHRMRRTDKSNNWKKHQPQLCKLENLHCAIEMLSYHSLKDILAEFS